jgi:transposase-like protein
MQRDRAAKIAARDNMRGMPMERPRFTREFKVEAVKLVRERGVAVRWHAI